MQPCITANCMVVFLTIVVVLLGTNIFVMRKSNIEISANYGKLTAEYEQSKETLTACEKDKATKEAALAEAKVSAETATTANTAAQKALDTCTANLKTATEEKAKAVEAAESAEAAKVAEAAKAEEAATAAEAAKADEIAKAVEAATAAAGAKAAKAVAAANVAKVSKAAAVTTAAA